MEWWLVTIAWAKGLRNVLIYASDKTAASVEAQIKVRYSGVNWPLKSTMVLPWTRPPR